jgi:hypothetical protein
MSRARSGYKEMLMASLRRNMKWKKSSLLWEPLEVLWEIRALAEFEEKYGDVRYNNGV